MAKIKKSVTAKKAKKGGLTSNKGRKLIGKAVDKVKADQQRRNNPSPNRVPPAPPGVNTASSRREFERLQNIRKYSTGSVKLVPRGGGVGRGGAGGGGILGSKIR